MRGFANYRDLSMRIGLLFFFFFLFTGCSSTSGNANAPTGQPIKIGVSLSLSGDFADDGKAFQRGYELWRDTINAHGGLLGRPVQLIEYSDASSPDQVQTNYQKLITVDKVDLLVGPFSTLLTKPSSVVANRYGYALVEGAGGGPSVFNRGLKNVFDVSLPVANNLVTFADYILSLPFSMRPRTAAYATQDDPFTQPQVDTARLMLEKGGVKTVFYTVYPAETTDYAPIANKIIASGAQVVVCGTLLPDISAFIQHFREQKYNPSALVATAGPDQGGDFVKAVGAGATEGVMVPNGWYPGINNAGNKQMVRDYIAKYGGTASEISADIAEAFSVGQVLAQAITQNQSLDQKKLLQTLHTGTFDSVQGPVKFDDTGQNTLALAYLFQWQKQQFLPVFPESVGAASPEFPKPAWS